MSKQSFADLGVSVAVRGALSSRGITAPFPIQALVLEDVLAGRDVLVKAPTGSGKTLAFGIPLAERLGADAAPQTGLVLAPTRELAAQIVAELEDLVAATGLRVAAVYGGVGLTAQAARAKRAHILVATPGRLEDLLARGAFTLARVRMLVLDEADRMLDMGFRPAIDRIVSACPERAPDAVLLRDARGGRGRRGGPLHVAGDQARASSAVGSREGAGGASIRTGQRRAASRGARRATGRRRGQDDRVRPYQARGRPARQATRRPRPSDGRDSRQQVSGTARPGPGPLPVGTTSTRSSRRTSQRGGSTSTASRT